MSSSQRLHYIDTEYITPVHVLDAVAQICLFGILELTFCELICCMLS